MDKNMRVLCITAFAIAIMFKWGLTIYNSLNDAKNAFDKVFGEK